jgi:hypothetical protein
MLRKRTGLFVCFALLLPLFMGCQSFLGSAKSQAPPMVKVERMVFFGFQPGLSPGQKPMVIQSPLTGSVFLAEPVTREVCGQLTDHFYAKLLKEFSFPLVSPGEAREALSNLKRASSSSGEANIEIFQEIGEALSGDVVLAGLVFRWEERIGTEFAVSRPASVAFEIALLKTLDGTILWTGRFDKTQASLTENVLDLGMFLKAKGRWMTAEELAEMGLSDLVKQLPVEKKD